MKSVLFFLTLACAMSPVSATADLVALNRILRGFVPVRVHGDQLRINRQPCFEDASRKSTRLQVCIPDQAVLPEQSLNEIRLFVFNSPETLLAKWGIAGLSVLESIVLDPTVTEPQIVWYKNTSRALGEQGSRKAVGPSSAYLVLPLELKDYSPEKHLGKTTSWSRAKLEAWARQRGSFTWIRAVTSPILESNPYSEPIRFKEDASTCRANLVFDVSKSSRDSNQVAQAFGVHRQITVADCRGIVACVHSVEDAGKVTLEEARQNQAIGGTCTPEDYNRLKQRLENLSRRVQKVREQIEETEKGNFASLGISVDPNNCDKPCRPGGACSALLDYLGFAPDLRGEACTVMATELDQRMAADDSRKKDSNLEADVRREIGMDQMDACTKAVLTCPRFAKLVNKYELMGQTIIPQAKTFRELELLIEDCEKSPLVRR